MRTGSSAACLQAFRRAGDEGAKLAIAGLLAEKIERWTVAETGDSIVEQGAHRPLRELGAPFHMCGILTQPNPVFIGF